MSRDYEFEAELENHELGNQNMYRLHYINYHRIGENYINRKNNIGVMEAKFDIFTLPKGMNREDAFKVLSYLVTYIEKTLSLTECSYMGVLKLNEALDLERLGFKKVPDGENIPDEDIIDLFTVTGRILLFKEDKNYLKYFNWYTEGVTKEEVKEIYQKLGKYFYDLIPIDPIDNKDLYAPQGNDSEEVAKLLKDFKYEPERTDEILEYYNNLTDKSRKRVK